MKVLVVDDHSLVRAGIKQVLQNLEPGNSVEVAEAGDGAGAMHALRMQPDMDLVLMDFDLPGKSGLAVLAELGRYHPETPVIMVSGASNPAVVQQALRQGASAFLTKSGDSEELLHAIREVLAGNAYVSPKLQTPQANLGTSAPGGPILSERQQEVLRLLTRGLSNREIGDQLHVSEETVKSHVGLIFKVFNVHSRVEAVTQARRWGYTSG